jgi:hypothetical protein
LTVVLSYFGAALWRYLIKGKGRMGEAKRRAVSAGPAS